MKTKREVEAAKAAHVVEAIQLAEAGSELETQIVRDALLSAFDAGYAWRAEQEQRGRELHAEGTPP